MKWTLQYWVILSSLLTLTFACGKSESKKSNSVSAPQEEVALEELNIDGHYQAKFITLNPHVNGSIPGSANFFRKEEKLFAFVRLFAGGPQAWHMQHVYTGSRCPNNEDDMNKDGFIDIMEAEAVLGKILIPLDSDISSQNSGKRFFPLADLSGYYHYERITSFKRFFEDLKSPDSDPNDDIIKLAPDENLSLIGKAVLIQGVTESVQLPSTVASKGKNRPFQTLPIVCGVFTKISTENGSLFDGNVVPGPIAEVEDGQDRPSADPTPGSNGEPDRDRPSNNTNESDDGNGPISDGEGNTTESDRENNPDEETTTRDNDRTSGTSENEEEENTNNEC